MRVPISDSHRSVAICVFFPRIRDYADEAAVTLPHRKRYQHCSPHGRVSDTQSLPVQGYSFSRGGFKDHPVLDFRLAVALRSEVWKGALILLESPAEVLGSFLCPLCCCNAPG